MLTSHSIMPLVELWWVMFKLVALVLTVANSLQSMTSRKSQGCKGSRNTPSGKPLAAAAADDSSPGLNRKEIFYLPSQQGLKWEVRRICLR